MRTRLPSLFVALVVALAPSFAHAAAATNAPAKMTAPALPDTGVFAPVARQFQAREARLRQLGDTVSAERLRLLLATGRSDEAAKIGAAAGLSGATSNAEPATLIAWGRVLLTRKDFAALTPLMARLEGGAHSGPMRTLRYQYLFSRDDAAHVDTLSRDAVAHADDVHVLPELLAAGKLAYDMLNDTRADTLFSRALAVKLPDSPNAASAAPAEAAIAEPALVRSAALVGLGLVRQKQRKYDESLTLLTQALEASSSPEALTAISESLVRLGRTDDAVSAVQWAVKLDPYYESAHYFLGNGYARKNYTQLAAAYPKAFADAAGRKTIANADAQLAGGQRDNARAAYAKIIAAHPGWADARVRLASLDFEDGRFAESRDGCFAALAACPEYGRAHGVIAKALEAQRATVDIHREGYEARFAAAPMPSVPGIEKFIANWRSLSPRHQKRVAMSVAPWKAFVPVLVDGGATYFIKPLYMLLSECPGLEPLRDQRISYDSRLWDDVRGAGGYHTVTGIEDVERTIFDKYNTVLHELTHQVHAVLPADDSRAIQELYRRAKERDDTSHEGYLSRYAGGSVFEYFAEGANSYESPMRDAYDPREVVRERLDKRDPDLRELVAKYLARTDVSASYAIAYAAGGDDRVSQGKVDEALPFYRKAIERSPTDETVMTSYANALVLGSHTAEAESLALQAVSTHHSSGTARVALAEAQIHAGRSAADVRASLAAGRREVRAEDRYLIDDELGTLAWEAGDVSSALAAYDSVLAYQSDSPEGLRGRASTLALASRWDEAFPVYDQAVRVRTGEVSLRCEVARDLLRAGRVDAATKHLEEAKLLDEENPDAEALRAWASLSSGALDQARAHAKQALAWGPWCDLARIVSGAIETKAGKASAAQSAWAPVLQRIEKKSPPEYVYRPKIATWEDTHRLPAVERAMLETFAKQNAAK